MEPLNAAARMTDMAAAAPAAAAAAAAQAVPNPNCTLIVPNHVLTAGGLATPFQLVATDPAGGPCNEANTAQSAFVEAAVFNPANSQISIYQSARHRQGHETGCRTRGSESARQRNRGPLDRLQRH